MNKLALIALALVLNLNAAQSSRTSIGSDGAILLNGRPFPMVLDAGTDCFTPQDYDTVMASKDAFGANTWWLQYTMRNMKSETEVDLEGLSRSLDFFGKTGMLVNLFLRAEYRDLPDWFYEQNHDYQMLDPAGKPVGRQICLQHEGFRRLVDNYLRRAARVAKAKPSLLMYSVYDEFCIRGWGCFCPRCIAGYRKQLQAQYGTVDALNRKWSTNYRDWGQIDAPRTQSFDQNYADWQHYRLKVLEDFGRLYYRAVKEEDPDHVAWIDINMDLYGYTWQRLCLWWKLHGIFDAFNLGPDAVADAGAIRTAMNRAVRDNYGKGATWHLGISEKDFIGRPEMYSLLFESNHGGVVWWYSFWDTLRLDQAWGVGSDLETPLRANWFTAREVNHLVRYLDDLYTNSKPVKGDVAIFVSGLTDMMRSLTARQVLQDEDPLNLGGMCQILRDLNIPYEAIGEDQLKQLGNFKAVFVGQFSMCGDDATAAAIRDYVRNGGLVVSTNYAFSAGETGKDMENPAFGLADVWGSSGLLEDQTGEGIITAGQDGNPLPAIAGLDFPTLGGTARRKPGAAQVVGRFQDGTPSITLNRYGKGQVLFIGTNAGEAYNAGHYLEMGTWPPASGKLDMQTYRKMSDQLKGWQNYAALVRETLDTAGVRSPVVVESPARVVPGKVRMGLQQERTAKGDSRYEMLVITVEPQHDPEKMVLRKKDEFVKPGAGSIKDLTVVARVPHPESVVGVYSIPVPAYVQARIDAVPEKISFEKLPDGVRIRVPEVNEAACLLIARDARPLVGVHSDNISAAEGKPTRIRVTVENATAGAIEGEITFPGRFRATPVAGSNARIQGLKPGAHYEGEFDVLAPAPLERNRTFNAVLNYRTNNGSPGSTASYAVTSRTDERIAWGWVKRVEAATAEAMQPPSAYGGLYEDALRYRELVYAAYHSGAWADTARLAIEHGRVCERIKEQKKQPRPPAPE
jgi:hypothetical protein